MALARQCAINVAGVVAAIRAASRVMQAGGRTVAIGSAIATRVGWPNKADHAATKAAVVAFLASRSASHVTGSIVTVDGSCAA